MEHRETAWISAPSSSSLKSSSSRRSKAEPGSKAEGVSRPSQVGGVRAMTASDCSGWVVRSGAWAGADIFRENAHALGGCGLWIKGFTLREGEVEGRDCQGADSLLWLSRLGWDT
jgi:hypothetical protein